jgi:hypothetical protein
MSEITATDHVNSRLLAMFKDHIESGKVPMFGEENQEQDGWEDDGAALFSLFFISFFFFSFPFFFAVSLHFFFLFH